MKSTSLKRILALTSSYTITDSKWITVLNVSARTVKFSEGSIERKLPDTGFGDDFLDVTTKAWAAKKK